jgi:putative transcriptional regulator
MKWNLRMVAAERGIWHASDLRRALSSAGLEISTGKMSTLWSTTPVTVRLGDLDVICAVLECEPSDLLVPEMEAGPPAAPQKPRPAPTPVRPTRTTERSLPPA